MARSREDSQDIALYHMDKLNRRNRSEEKPLNSQEALKEALEYSKLSPIEKMKRKTSYDWEMDLRAIINTDRKANIGSKLYQWVSSKYKKEMKEFHEQGVPYTTVLAFIRDKQMEYMNS